MNASKRPRSKLSSGASVQAQTFSITAYFSNHKKVGIETLVKLFRTWVASLMTWLVIGIAFALPLILYILLDNVNQLGGEWQGKPRISIYLKSNLGESESRRILDSLNQNSGVASARLITAEEALVDFQAESGFNDVLSSLPFNPLPAVIEVDPKASTPAALKLLVAKLADRPGIDFISFDLEWVERLFAILALGERFVSALSVFLGLGVLLSIGNTIRLAIENRRAEIEVVKLVGGTDSFVRRPFLYLGLWYGLGGAFFAWVMVQISLVFLSSPIERLLHSYQNDFYLVGLGFVETLILLASGAFLGVLGAGIAVGRHLHRIEPT